MRGLVLIAVLKGGYVRCSRTVEAQVVEEHINSTGNLGACNPPFKCAPHTSLERFDHDKDDDEQHQHGGNFIPDAVERFAPGVPVVQEVLAPFREKPMGCGQQ